MGGRNSWHHHVPFFFGIPGIKDAGISRNSSQHVLRVATRSRWWLWALLVAINKMHWFWVAGIPESSALHLWRKVEIRTCLSESNLLEGDAGALSSRILECVVPLKGLSFPFAPEHLPGWGSTQQWLARRPRAAAPERPGSAGYTASKLLPLPWSSELSLQITSWMTETWQGEWQRQAELRARKVQLPCARDAASCALGMESVRKESISSSVTDCDATQGSSAKFMSWSPAHLAPKPFLDTFDLSW